MDEMTIYWITRLDAFKNAFEFISIVSFITAIAIGVITFIATFDCEVIFDTELLRSFKRIICISFVCFVLFGLMNCLMPSTKEIFAIKCIPVIASKENIEKFKDISNDMLDVTAAYIKDLKKNK